MRALSTEEKAILRRARGGHVAAACQPRHVAPTSSAPYPPASLETLALLGTIDALLKAPPAPARSTLLQVLAIIEECRERPRQYMTNPPLASLSQPGANCITASSSTSSR